MQTNKTPEVPNIKLNNGTTIPQVGLGLWEVKTKEECWTSIQTALDAGYRHFDSAQAYGNEASLGDVLGEAFRGQSNLTREDIFITTKLWNENQKAELALPAFEESLENLQTDYVDLFLIHFPQSDTRQKAWKVLETIYASKKAKSIGVSNYTITHLEELLDNTDIVPAINQVELHVFLQQKELQAYCAEKGIVIEAYSPLAHGKGLDDAALVEIGKKYLKSPAQIMLRWLTQNGMVVLPKSITPSRINENIDIYDFELSSKDLEVIGSLEKGLRTCWDPTDIA